MTIDWWTLGLQTVNLVVLVWLLGRFFWRPVAATIAERRAAAVRLLDEAEAKRAEAAAGLAGIERTRAGLVQEREAILSAAHDAAEQARAGRLDEAAAEAAALRAAAAAQIEKDKGAAEKAWSDRANRLAIEISGRLASRLSGPAVQGVFLDWLILELKRLEEPARLALAANEAPLEAVTAAPLDPAEQETVRARIGAVLGALPRIEFSVDPALISGLELHAPNLVVRNSWRADLTQILDDIAHDHRS